MTEGSEALIAPAVCRRIYSASLLCMAKVGAGRSFRHINYQTLGGIQSNNGGLMNGDRGAAKSCLCRPFCTENDWVWGGGVAGFPCPLPPLLVSGRATRASTRPGLICPNHQHHTPPSRCQLDFVTSRDAGTATVRSSSDFCPGKLGISWKVCEPIWHQRLIWRGLAQPFLAAL